MAGIPYAIAISLDYAVDNAPSIEDDKCGAGKPLSAVQDVLMQRINAQYFYQLATAILPLRTLEPAPIIDAFSTLWTAERFLRAYLTNEITSPTASLGSGWDLHNAIKALTDNLSREEPMSYPEVSNIKDVLLPKFENNLEAEYSTKDVFIVSKKGIYSITELIEGAENVFTKEVQQRIASAIPDIQQAGRCIAFEVPTAAAFHIFRAVEAVAKDYVQKVRGKAPTDKEERFGIGGFVKILEENGADARVTNALGQLAKLHRNPTMHPALSIGSAEAVATLGMAQSVIQSMVADMEKRRDNPVASIVEVLPIPETMPVTEEDKEDASEGVKGRQTHNVAGAKNKASRSKVRDGAKLT